MRFNGRSAILFSNVRSCGLRRSPMSFALGSTQERTTFSAAEPDRFRADIRADIEMESLSSELYVEQSKRWPQSGWHILAQFDDDTIVVYQAYRPSIGKHAIDHGVLGGPEFNYSRMSWIKPNFLWMMYRSGWGTKQGQEITLALRIRRSFFEDVLSAAVPSTFSFDAYEDRDEWKAAVDSSQVRLQWDPDHDPYWQRVDRRAIQLGLRGGVLRSFAGAELIEVSDLSGFVATQRQNVAADRLQFLCTPAERVYTPSGRLAERIGLSAT